MHSYSHNYDQIYANVGAFSKDLMKLQKYLYDLTDVKPYIVTASKWGLTAVFTIVFLISFNKEFSAVKSTYDQIKPGLEAIEQAVEKGENEV